MNVRAILAAKGNATFGIDPTANLTEAIKLMTTHQIGALLIRGAGGRLAGIISERDIVRAVSEHGAEALSLSVSRVMMRNVNTCTEDDSCASIMERMTTGKFRHLPVVKNGMLLGVVSIGDVVKQRVEEIERESDAMREYIRKA
jgi:CBS domain-containing protein